MNYEELLSKLDPKTQKRVLRASEIKIDRRPYASVGLTRMTGGFAMGRIHLIYGPKSAGKSMSILQTVARHQDNLTAAIIDSEGTIDPAFCERYGLDTEKIMVNNSKSFDAAQDFGVEVIKAGVDILVLDSISTLIPGAFLDDKGETKGADGQKQMAVRAKSTGVMMNSFHYNNENTAIFVISHGKMDLSGSHAKMTYDGGKNMEHSASQIIRLTASAAESQQLEGEVFVGDRVFKKPIGREVNVFVEKNKLGPASGTSKYNMFYNGDFVGIDVYGETITAAIEMGIVEKGGAWLKYKGRQWQGLPKMSLDVRRELDLFEELEREVIEAENAEG